MNYSYTYKDQTGARREAMVSADSRTQVFAILKAKGITPLSVRAEEKGGLAHSKPVASWVRGVVAGVIVIASVGIIWILLKATAPQVSAEKTETRSVLRKSPAKTTTSEVTNTVGDLVDTKTTQPAKAPLNRVEDVQSEVPAATNDVEATAEALNRSKPTFKTDMEQVMSWIFTTELGSAPPPLPNLSKKDMQSIVAILLSKNEVAEEDSEKTALAKNVVEQAKKELKQYLKDGGDPQSFLTFYHNELKKASDEWKDAQKIVLQSLKEDGVEAGVAFAEEVNKKLTEKGIKRVVIPPKYLKALNAEENGK